jgi:hypothetical protein
VKRERLTQIVLVIVGLFNLALIYFLCNYPLTSRGRAFCLSLLRPRKPLYPYPTQNARILFAG